MMKTLAETGNGWMTFKDHSNVKCNQTKDKGNTIHLSNLCTEILEVTSQEQTAVCNLGSINLSNFYHPKDQICWKKLARTVGTAIQFLDRVVDINFYPIATAENSNAKWRPVGLGLMGWQDLLFKLQWPFDSLQAKQLAEAIQEEVYYHAVKTSCELAEKHGAHPFFKNTRASDALLQYDLWSVTAKKSSKMEEIKRSNCKTRVKKFFTGCYRTYCHYCFYYRSV